MKCEFIIKPNESFSNDFVIGRMQFLLETSIITLGFSITCDSYYRFVHHFRCDIAL